MIFTILLSKIGTLKFRVILQRQFFEAIVRICFVRFANESSRFPTLAEKLEHMFKQFMLPNAGKTKAKSPEDEVKHLTTIFQKNFKLAEKAYETYDEKLLQIFQFFSKRTNPQIYGIQDNTIEVDDLLRLVKVSGLIISLRNLSFSIWTNSLLLSSSILLRNTSIWIRDFVRSQQAFLKMMNRKSTVLCISTTCNLRAMKSFILNSKKSSLKSVSSLRKGLGLLSRPRVSSRSFLMTMSLKMLIL